MAEVSAPASGERLLPIREVAARLAISPRTTWRLIAEGDLPTLRIGPRGTRVLESELHAYLMKLKAVAR